MMSRDLSFKKSKNLSTRIAIIPARGGSKRIPRKNIKDFLGKPIMAYSIGIALESGLFDEVMVSTDDEEIAEIAKKHGAKVAFMRSKKNADDFMGPGDVCFEVLNEYRKQKLEFSEACCIYATAPFISIEKLIESHEILTNSDFDLVFPVNEFNSPIWRSYKMINRGMVEMNFPEYAEKRSQDLPLAFSDAGQFYWFRVDQFKKLSNKNTFGSKKGVVVISNSEAQDMNTESDWRVAEMKCEMLKKLKDG